MNVVFVSCFMNHHQKPLCDRMYELLEGNFTFIETKEMSDERKNLGWSTENVPSYVKKNYTSDEDKAGCQKLIDLADVVIFGSAGFELIKKRLKKKKLTMFYSERIYKKKMTLWKWPIYLVKSLRKYGMCKNAYLLCASAYAAGDNARTLGFVNKAYKWGYFPKTMSYENTQMLIESKKKASVIWVGRCIDWKHPELAVDLAQRLKESGYAFELNIIGTGVLEDYIKNTVKEKELSDCVNVLGPMSPQKVREHMEESEIHIFTSDRNEGWGAVLNESMNSACVPVADKAIGSAPFLVNEGENGLLYDGSAEDLYNKVKYLLDSPEELRRMSACAHNTISNEWNGTVAADKLIKLMQMLLQHGKAVFPFEEGVCSKAKIM